MKKISKVLCMVVAVVMLMTAMSATAFANGNGNGAGDGTGPKNQNVQVGGARLQDGSGGNANCPFLTDDVVVAAFASSDNDSNVCPITGEPRLGTGIGNGGEPKGGGGTGTGVGNGGAPKGGGGAKLQDGSGGNVNCPFLP